MFFIKHQTRPLRPDLHRLTPLIMAIGLTSCGATVFSKKKKSTPTIPPVATAPEVAPPELPPLDFLGKPILNHQDLAAAVGLTPWTQAGHHGRSIKIAILDNGFYGLSDVSGRFMPHGLSVAASPIKNEARTPHGTILAQIIATLTSGSSTWSGASQAPTLLLYNANGYTNFAAAVDQAMADGADMILYSQVWEFGGNFDGRGFINAVVNKALRAGVLWINAAGNYAESSWQGPLLINADKTARLPHESQFIRLRVAQNDTPVKLTLSWNDFSDSKDWRTSRDLDLFLHDSQGRILEAATKIQDGRDHGGDARYSAHAREIIMTNLAAGDYLLSVRAASANFDGFSRLRIAADGDQVELLDKSDDASIMIPADNPFVVTIGAADTRQSSFGRTVAGATKPDVLTPSLVSFGPGISLDGSSTAAAVAAAIFAVYEGHCGKINYADAQRLIRSEALIKKGGQTRLLSLPASPECY
jgi:hypothetical protein